MIKVSVKAEYEGKRIDVKTYIRTLDDEYGFSNRKDDSGLYIERYPNSTLWSLWFQLEGHAQLEVQFRSNPDDGEMFGTYEVLYWNDGGETPPDLCENAKVTVKL